MIGICSLLNASTYKEINLASIISPDKPTTSTSHWVNSLSLPTFTVPSLNTLLISYLLNGYFILFLFRAMNLAKGTVRSYNSEEVESQIKALFDNGLTGGYMPWNAFSAKNNLEKYKKQKALSVNNY